MFGLTKCTLKKPEQISFIYHDIVPNGRPSHYGIDVVSFEKQVEALATIGKPSILINSFFSALSNSYCFTFDDGNESAIRIAAPILEKYGAKGHFFIITGKIGRLGYLTENEIIELHNRGHVVGSHGHSHDPLKNNDTDEWLKSIEILSTILKEKITIASVPGGWYSKSVAIAAEKAGIEWLFTSEPTVKIRKAGNCNIAGRFSVGPKTTEVQVINILEDKFPSREKQWLFWNIKKVVKLIGARRYLKMREGLKSK